MTALPISQTHFFGTNTPTHAANRRLQVWMLSALLSLLPAITAAKQEGTIRIVTDIAPVHSLVMLVAGEHAQVDFLIKNGQSPHDAYLKPSDARKLYNADWVFHVGANLAPQFERQAQALVQEGKITSLIDLPQTHQIKGPQSLPDPHAWLDINNARAWLIDISRTLALYDPGNAASYQHNSKRAQAQLAALDLSISQTMATINHKPFIVQHDAYSYFIDRYQLRKLGALSSNSGHETGASKLKDMHLLSSEATCIFGEAGEPTAVIDVINKESQLPIGILDPIGLALQPGQSLYNELMQALATSFAECLQSTP